MQNPGDSKGRFKPLKKKEMIFEKSLLDAVEFLPRSRVPLHGLLCDKRDVRLWNLITNGPAK